MVSSDTNFATTVLNLEGRIVECVENHAITSRMEIQKLICDYHPNISCTIKGLTQIPDGEMMNELDGNTTWQAFSSFFNVSYFVDESFKYVQPNGEIVHSFSVSNEGITLPDNLVYVNSEDSPCPFLSTTDPSFFRCSNYVQILFS